MDTVKRIAKRMSPKEKGRHLYLSKTAVRILLP